MEISSANVMFSPGLVASSIKGSDKQIVVTVPVGAATGAVVVTVVGLLGSKTFTVH